MYKCLTLFVFEMCAETARVEVYLDTPLPAGVKEIEAVTFRAELRHNFFNAPSVLYLSGNELTRCEVINNGPTTHTIETAVDEGYFVQPKTFTILPNQSFVFHAGYQHGLYTYDSFLYNIKLMCSKLMKP